MIGMHDLAHVAIKVEPPRDAARLPERKQLAREAGGAAEIDEPDMIARAVDRPDPEGRARRSARAIVLRGHVDDDRLPRLHLLETPDRKARDEAGPPVAPRLDNAIERPQEHTLQLQSLTHA